MCQRGPKQGSEVTEMGEGVGGGFPPSHGREIFLKIVYENGIFFHTKWHYKGVVICEVAYVPIPYIFPLLKISFTPIKGDHGPLCILAIPVTAVQPGFVNKGGQSKGAKWPRGGRVWEGVGGRVWEGVFPLPW